MLLLETCPSCFLQLLIMKRKKNARSSTQAHFPFVNAPFLKGKYKKFLSPIVEVYLSLKKVNELNA